MTFHSKMPTLAHLQRKYDLLLPEDFDEEDTEENRKRKFEYEYEEAEYQIRYGD